MIDFGTLLSATTVGLHSVWAGRAALCVVVLCQLGSAVLVVRCQGRALRAELALVRLAQANRRAVALARTQVAPEFHAPLADRLPRAPLPRFGDISATQPRWIIQGGKLRPFR